MSLFKAKIRNFMIVETTAAEEPLSVPPFFLQALHCFCSAKVTLSTQISHPGDSFV